MAQIGTDLNKAKLALEAQKLVAIPTETVYGLAANGINEIAVSRIFAAKNRPAFDPLILHSDTLEKITSLCKNKLNDKALLLARKFWPGPLTLVLPKSSLVPDIVSSGLPTVALRIPRHPLTLKLLSMLNFPLAAPSANPFGYVSPTTATHVSDQLDDRLDYILDGGPCRIGLESTIVGFEGNEAIVYRKGSLPIDEIENVIGKVVVRDKSTSAPNAPGMLVRHYSPGVKLLLGDIESLLEKHGTDNVAVLSFQKRYDSLPENMLRILSEKGDLQEAARNLFSYLQYFGRLKPRLIVAELVPDKGLGLAINDRLKRAATGKNLLS